MLRRLHSIVVANNRPISEEQRRRYDSEGAHQIFLDRKEVSRILGPGTEVILADLLEEGEMVRHCPDKLARVIISCYKHSNVSVVASS
jgi:hypothetical protein